MSEFIELSRIRLDGGTQPRSAIFDETVAEYVDAMERGEPFPPVVLFFDGSDYWLADGFHRFAAAEQLRRGGLSADVRQGTQRDAVLFSVGVNADHGRPRTNADKRRAVARLLHDDEWGAWSDREIARRCRVGAPLVGTLRAEIADTVTSYSVERTFVHPKTGAPATMKTANIGRRPEPGPSEYRAPAPQPVAPAPVAPRAPSDIDPNWANAATVSNPVFEILQTFDSLIPPSEAVHRWPRSLVHALNPNDARAVAAWFAAFADAWTLQHGDDREAAE